MLSRVIINAVFGLFVFLVGATVVNAAAIGVSPVRVTLSDKQKMGTLTVRNNGAEPVSMQLEVLNWSQEEGNGVFTPTRELIVNPPIFTIPAGGSQLIRVGLRRAPDAQRELTYRIFLQELPPPPNPELSGSSNPSTACAAIAASTAWPPRANIAAAASVARGLATAAI
mgnify:CR=1 FL=1